MTNDNSVSIVSKVWNYAHVLKSAGGKDSAKKLSPPSP